VRVIVGREEEEEEEEEMETMEELLSGHPFFAGLDADALRLMAGCASNAHFAAGEFIFCEGEAAHRFYLIRAGRVSLEIHSPTRGPVIIDTMDEGEVLGWSWLIPPYRFFGDARAVTPVSAIALDGACLRGKCEADAQLGYQLLKRVTAVMYQRLESARVRLLDLYGSVPALSRPRLTVKVVHGYTVEEIIKAARDADMLVLGSRGAGGFARMVMGSTCYLVAHHAPCPVLIVRSDDRK
jgi:CRP/FNR family transcriptional regulator, cyclic AMP receptor protein